MNGTNPLVALAVLVAACAPHASGAEVKLAEVVKFEFPKDGYAFTLAEAAQGVKLEYKITVAQDFSGVIPLPHGPSAAEPAGASGLHPREMIAGNEQVYCLMDFGLAPPPTGTERVLKKGSYAHSFAWDGRNWTGPSDFGNPKGKPFPAGTYDVTVTIHGTLATAAGKVPYRLTGKTKLVLK